MYFAQTTKERIKLICKKRNINAKQMLSDCSLGANAIQQINDTKGMASFSLAKIADYLDVSVDYLLGRTNNPEVNDSSKLCGDFMFWERFYSLCEKANIKPNPLAKQLGISSGVLNKWKNGGIPNSNSLVKIADYFSVSTDYLLGRTENFHNSNKEQSENNLSSDGQKLMDIYNSLSDDDKILLMAYGLQLQRNMPILNVVNKPTKQDT